MSGRVRLLSWFIGGFAAIGASALLFVALIRHGLTIPIVRFPPPTGTYGVGTSALTLGTRVAVQVWYPSQRGETGRRAPYRIGTETGSLNARVSAALMQTDASIDVPIAAGRFPVVIYAPSWGGNRWDNTAHIQNLASHGFVIVAMDDLYASRPLDLSSATAFHATLDWAARKARLQATAALGVLAAFEQLSVPGARTRFAGHIDSERAGIFGFSFGGAVAAEAATLDPRIRAVADLDGWIFADAADHGVEQPFLIVSSSAGDAAAAQAADREDHRYSDILDKTNLKAMLDGLERHGGYYLTVSGTDHYNFADVSLMPSFRHRGVGPIDSWRAQRIVATYLVQFFDRFLNDRDAPLLEAKNRTGTADAARVTIDPAAHLEIWQSRAGRSRTAAAPGRDRLGSARQPIHYRTSPARTSAA